MKPITCIKCSYQQKIVSSIDPEGFAVQMGWDEMRAHVALKHPDYAKQLDYAFDVPVPVFD